VRRLTSSASAGSCRADRARRTSSGPASGGRCRRPPARSPRRSPAPTAPAPRPRARPRQQPQSRSNASSPSLGRPRNNLIWSTRFNKLTPPKVRHPSRGHPSRGRSSRKRRPPLPWPAIDPASVQRTRACFFGRKRSLTPLALEHVPFRRDRSRLWKIVEWRMLSAANRDCGRCRLRAVEGVIA